MARIEHSSEWWMELNHTNLEFITSCSTRGKPCVAKRLLKTLKILCSLPTDVISKDITIEFHVVAV